MKRRQFFGVSMSALSPAPGLAQTASAASIKAGFAERDITPSIGMEQPGGYGKVFHRAFHDACKVRAAVFDDGTSRVALVGVDALMVPRSAVAGARRAIRQRCGIAEGSVLIGASHSHSSGPVGMVQPGEFDHASSFVRKLAYEHSSAADAGYLLRVETEIANAVCDADNVRAQMQLGFGSGVESHAAFNRRFRMKNGLSYTHPGQGNRDIVRVAGPIDPEVGVIGAWTAAGRLTGCVVNYACHATTNPGGISANWIHYMEQMIRGSFGADVTVVFLQGFCGDITQVNNLNPYRQPSGDEYARLVGGRVGAEAVKVLLSTARGDAGPVAARATNLKIARRRPSADRLRECLELASKDPKEVGAARWVFAKEIVLLDALLAKETEVDVEIQAAQIGPAVFVAAPGEMFCQLGLDIKKGSRFPFTWPVELANGCVGYVPTEDAFGKEGGGYETRLTSYSNLATDAGPRMVEAGVALARSLTPGRAPEPPPAVPFKEPWSYGNVPPELH